jgi:hypothetical protein
MILWHIDPFPGSDRETNNETTFTTRQQINKNRQPLLGNGLVNVPAATGTHATIEELLEMLFSTWPMLRCYNRDSLERLVQCSVESWAVKRRLGGWHEMATSLGASQLIVRQ